MSTPEPSKGLPGPNPHSSVDTSRWWRYPNLRALNLLMIIPLLSIFSQGSVRPTHNWITSTKLKIPVLMEV